jgi:cation/acetate symporter
MSAASFISLAGSSRSLHERLRRVGYLMGWTGGYVLLALLLAPYLRKFGKYTVPDFVGDRYSETARLVAVVARHPDLLHLRGRPDGRCRCRVQPLPGSGPTQGVIIGMVIVFFYAVLGGMKGITWTQVAQYSVLIVAYLIPASRSRRSSPACRCRRSASARSSASSTRLQQDLGFAAYTEAFTQTSMLNMVLITPR